ncbi:hypothetical protein H2248_006586 [Termitomyces sp. 'cryptogamus']|nr:hypothetical protein H2248_006586 [Termitomyces sp. 'cryptogamus']
MFSFLHIILLVHDLIFLVNAAPMSTLTAPFSIYTPMYNPTFSSNKTNTPSSHAHLFSTDAGQTWISTRVIDSPPTTTVSPQ